MVKSEELKQVRYSSNMINNLMAEQERVRDDLVNIKAISYKEAPVKTTSGKDKATELIAKIIEYDNLISEEMNKLYDLKVRIQQSIQNLEDPYKTIIYFRYIALKDWQEISDTLHYSRMHLYRLHLRALELLNQL